MNITWYTANDPVYLLKTSKYTVEVWMAASIMFILNDKKIMLNFEELTSELQQIFSDYLEDHPEYKSNNLEQILNKELERQLLLLPFV